MGVEKVTISDGDKKNYPSAGDKLTMHYTGYFPGQKNNVFDSSVSRGKPFQFTIGVGQVIKGWDEGVKQMSLGEKATLKISSDYGYGAGGAGNVIPPNADLEFEVQLLKINSIAAPGVSTGSESGCMIL
mmetsp:Transcript_24300/g.36452  ORF Transcript_24300/g.36452 Transcript_24300/m.36452 type:complete len:129 (-) Transcript_24300:220-606(-)|eukprot:CAMPEP_0167755194 /NCGR_PEP_ID=MMETSP0110_2-20121227/8688_1 /TAXON_ID=629695 /ORGANISM="Gymnochlora sp., Strain CCMP2014" /LENGTH=128 /DNA_ID=CAMNT_0007641153 /DNA_START=21 /DNA_END=407 /DNA_ORIENTATION=-